MEVEIAYPYSVRMQTQQLDQGGHHRPTCHEKTKALILPLFQYDMELNAPKGIAKYCTASSVDEVELLTSIFESIETTNETR